MIITESDIREAIKKVLKEVRYIDVAYRPNSDYKYDEREKAFRKISDEIRDYGWEINNVKHLPESSAYFFTLYRNNPTDYNDFERLQQNLKILLSSYCKIQMKQTSPVGKYETCELYARYKSDSNFSPIQKGEKIRVFHGTDLQTAILIAKEGLSGKQVIGRTYSYENGMNPAGLFVSTDFNVIKDNSFGFHYEDRVIIEFTANADDLDAPVWNDNDTYFGQGSNPQPFISRAERQQQKVHYYHTAKDTGEPWVKDSDNPAMADKIFNNNEHQALFFGDLRPNMIKRFWVMRFEGSSPKDKAFRPMTLQQFLKIYGNHAYTMNNGSKQTVNSYKIYYPDEDYNGPEDFAKHFAQKEGEKYYDEALEIIQNYENKINNWEDLSYSDLMTLKQLMFPKQLIGLMGADSYRDNYDKFYPEFRTPGHIA